MLTDAWADVDGVASGAGDATATHLALAGAAASVATLVTAPLDLVKTRLQLLRGAPGGMARVAVDVARTDGVVALWSGLGPGLVRAFTYSGLRIALYPRMKRAVGAVRARVCARLAIKYTREISKLHAVGLFVCSFVCLAQLQCPPPPPPRTQDERPSVWRKVVAGSAAGTVAALVANPFEVRCAQVLLCLCCLFCFDLFRVRPRVVRKIFVFVFVFVFSGPTAAPGAPPPACDVRPLRPVACVHAGAEGPGAGGAGGGARVWVDG